MFCHKVRPSSKLIPNIDTSAKKKMEHFTHVPFYLKGDWQVGIHVFLYSLSKTRIKNTVDLSLVSLLLSTTLALIHHTNIKFPSVIWAQNFGLTSPYKTFKYLLEKMWVICSNSEMTPSRRVQWENPINPYNTDSIPIKTAIYCSHFQQKIIAFL